MLSVIDCTLHVREYGINIIVDSYVQCECTNDVCVCACVYERAALSVYVYVQTN